MIERFGELPDDVDELKALALDALARVDRSETDAQALRSQTSSLTAKVEDLTQTNAAAKAEIDRLTSIIKTLHRDRFGKRSEKLGADDAEQQSFVFEEVETGLATIDARLAAKADAKPRKAPRDKPRFPSHLERVEEILEPEVPEELQGKERVEIGREESVRLDVVRARFRLIVTIRPKYAYKDPAAILQAPAPEHIVEAGLPTEALLAQVAVSKYADGLPLYRQEAIYLRDGVELGRSLMAQWMGAVGFHFEPLAAHVLARIREGERIFADETTLPTLSPGAGKTKTSWLWAYARDDRPFGGAGPPMVAYRFEESRSGDCAARHLGDYRGILQCDGYAGYRKLAGAPHSNGLHLAGCWAHLRHRFFELHANGESIVATATVEQMKLLWAVEEEVRGQPPQARLAARRVTSVDIVQALFDLWERELPRISGKSKLAEAIRYARSHRAVLGLFLDDGRVEIDSNIVERAIRPQAITRKNSLFAGSAGGGRTWASIATMLQTCKMNGVDPYAWAQQALERIANRWPNKNIEALMPWNFKPTE
ncbi:IS66 family transposase [Methylosinus sporium]|uniref:IS66 family transposase n=1 Tax=Methylosinus sporium TaxID=428 RepID=UPI003DA73E10